GAAFIDDILGVIILTIISNIVIGNKISLYSINKILIKIILFFIFSFIFGLLIPKLYKCFRNMSQDYVILIITIAICFIFSILSAKVNLAPIVGAFVSGIMITQTDQIRKIQKDIKPIYAFFVPIFFVLMGTNIKLNIFNPFIMKNVKFFIMTISLFIAAFVGKLLSGFAILRTKLNKLIIGLSMVPRGEVGLIFASIGLQYHIFDVNYYSVLITVIMLLTIITPILLKYILTKK
ncbi:MAG: cation:proton antiporter, partial [Endomicrobium sp.]|nr:cation:proton antiporter [Endomicrobium sp.]